MKLCKTTQTHRVYCAMVVLGSVRLYSSESFLGLLSRPVQPSVVVGRQADMSGL